LIDEIESFEAAIRAAEGGNDKAGPLSVESSTSAKEESMGSEEGKNAKPAEISAEDFATSHPEAVEAWREEGRVQGREEGKKAAGENLAALADALPERPGAALKAALEGQSPTEAKAALADELAAENAELKKKAAAVEAAGGTEAVSGGEAPASGKAPDFVAQAKARQKEKGGTLQENMSELAKEDPDSFKAYKASLRPAGK
jgi:hypothetical protein